MTVLNQSTVMVHFNAGCFDALREHMRSVDWQALQSLDAENACNYLVSVLQEGTAASVPRYEGKNCRKNIYMTASAMKLKKKKLKLWRESLKTAHPYDKLVAEARYAHCNNELRCMTRRLRVNYGNSHIADFTEKHNAKTFWRYVHSRMKVRQK